MRVQSKKCIWKTKLWVKLSLVSQTPFNQSSANHQPSDRFYCQKYDILGKAGVVYFGLRLPRPMSETPYACSDTRTLRYLRTQDAGVRTEGFFTPLRSE